jgi:Ca-activated chloride channel homolog
MSGLLTNFLAPHFLGFLGLIPIVILLYLLKLRRTEVVIASTMLWLKSLQDLTANAPFQRLRANLLLFLQILALFLLALALSRPFLRAEGARGDNLCLIIDRSASMATEEMNGSRLALAKEKALELVEAMDSGDRMMVIAFADSAEVGCDLTDNRRRLRQAIEGIQASNAQSNLRDVMLLARSLAPRNEEVESVVPDLELLLLSDGKISDAEQMDGLSMNLTFLQIGETVNNAGIVRFSLRNPEEGVGDRQVFVSVHNENTQPLDTTLSLYFDDSLLAVEAVQAPPGKTTQLAFAMPPLAESGLLRAELDQEDALDVDNRAWLALRDTAFLQVLLVSENDAGGAFFLRRALTLDPRVQLSATTPENYTDTGGYDLTIFNAWAPELPEESDPEAGIDMLPMGASLFINALPPLPGLRAEGTVENPALLATASDHPLTRFLHPGNTRIAKALRVTLPEGAINLISTANSTLLADVSRGGHPVAICTFDLADSNWPLHLSFPLFVQNLLAWLPRSGAASEMSVQAGTPLELMGTPEESTVRVELPDGSSQELSLDPTRPVLFGNTEQTGPYQVIHAAVNEGDEPLIEYHAVNLLDQNESAIAPAKELRLGRGTAQALEGNIQFNREFWRALLAAALVVLLVEWWIYSRRAWM